MTNLPKEIKDAADKSGLVLLSGTIKKADKEPDVYEIWASDNRIDLHDDIVEPTAFQNLPEWLTTMKGRILYGHSWILGGSADTRLTVAKALEATVVPEKGMRVKFIFADMDFPNKLKWLADHDFALFASIGGYAKESLEERLQDGRIIRRIKNFRLIEMSLVEVPANEGASFIRQLKVASFATKAESIFKDIEGFNNRPSADAKSASEGPGALKSRYLEMVDRFNSRR